LEEREEEIPHIHNLVTLRERTGISVEEAELNVMDRLNRLYIGARYPGVDFFREENPLQRRRSSFSVWQLGSTTG
jgi:HEPN domain-containing protein